MDTWSRIPRSRERYLLTDATVFWKSLVGTIQRFKQNSSLCITVVFMEATHGIYLESGQGNFWSVGMFTSSRFGNSHIKLIVISLNTSQSAGILRFFLCKDSSSSSPPFLKEITVPVNYFNGQFLNQQIVLQETTLEKLNWRVR